MTDTLTATETPADAQVMHGPSRERWLAHEQFCRRMSTAWMEFAEDERHPDRRARFLCDAKSNLETAELAMRMARDMEES